MSWGTPIGAGNLATTSATTITVPLTGVSVGDVIVVWVKWEGGNTTATCSDGTSTLTSWAPGVISRPSADPRGKAFYLLASVASGSVTYTVTFGAARTFREVVAYRATPSGTASLDGTAVGNNGSSTTCSSGNITTTSSDGLAFGFYGDFGNTQSAEKINGVAAGGNTHAGSNASETWWKTYSAGFTGAATCSLGISNDWLGGILAFGNSAGGGGTTFTASLDGTAASAGTIAKAIAVAKAGTAVSSGSAAKAAAIAKAGTAGSAGAATKKANKAFAGTATSSGALSNIRAALIALAGTVASAGSLAKSVGKSVAGACSSAGTIAKAAAHSLAGTVASSGALAKLVRLAKAGTAASAGALSSTKVALLAIAGTVASAGVLTRSTLKGLTASCASAGGIAKACAKGLAGSVAPSGALRKLISRAFAGVAASAGAVVTAFVSGSDLIIGLLGTFIVPAARVLFFRKEPDVTTHDASPPVVSHDPAPRAITHEPTTDD